MELTEKRKEILHQFRESLRKEFPQDYEDWFLLRWLRARNFNLSKAEQMFRENMEWRRKFKMDDIESWQPPEVLEKYFIGGHVGFDKEGSPVWVDTGCLCDWRGLVRFAKKSDIMKMSARISERLNSLLPAQSKKLGRPVTQSVMIMDMEKLGTRHLNKDCTDTLTAMIAQSDAYYPQYTKRVFVVKAPKIFSVLHSILRPFLSEETKKNLKVLGSNWKEVLLQHIDAEELPAYLGGTKTGPHGDIYCKHLIKQGGEIPREYYLKGTSQSAGEKLTKAVVSRRGTLQLPYDVTNAGSIIKWSFETKDYDLAFGIYLKGTDSPKKQDMKQVFPTAKVNSHLVPEDGYFTCEEAGAYVFTFDNTYSWLHSKEVQYVVEVLDPVNEQL